MALAVIAALLGSGRAPAPTLAADDDGNIAFDFAGTPAGRAILPPGTQPLPEDTHLPDIERDGRMWRAVGIYAGLPLYADGRGDYVCIGGGQHGQRG